MKVKKIIIILIVLVAIAFVGSFVWINLGLERVFDDKTLNVSYEEFLNDKNIQDFLDLQLQESRRGGYFFDKYTEYTEEKNIDNGNVNKKIYVTVDNSKNEIEEISIHYKFLNDTYDSVFSTQLDVSFFSAAFLKLIDANMEEDAKLEIMNMMTNLTDLSHEDTLEDSITYNGITYSVDLIGGYSILITPAD